MSKKFVQSFRKKQKNKKLNSTVKQFLRLKKFMITHMPIFQTFFLSYRKHYFTFLLSKISFRKNWKFWNFWFQFQSDAIELSIDPKNWNFSQFLTQLDPIGLIDPPIRPNSKKFPKIRRKMAIFPDFRKNRALETLNIWMSPVSITGTPSGRAHVSAPVSRFFRASIPHKALIFVIFRPKNTKKTRNFLVGGQVFEILVKLAIFSIFRQIFQFFDNFWVKIWSEKIFHPGVNFLQKMSVFEIVTTLGGHRFIGKKVRASVFTWCFSHVCYTLSLISKSICMRRSGPSFGISFEPIFWLAEIIPSIL